MQPEMLSTSKPLPKTLKNPHGPSSASMFASNPLCASIAAVTPLLAALPAIAHVTGNSEPLEMLDRTLDGMSRGGLRDQLDGGFFRYTVDADWTIPHFEKMLYDNALLLPIYAEASRRRNDAWLGTVATGIVSWMEAWLGGPGEAFASSMDADAGGEGSDSQTTGDEDDSDSEDESDEDEDESKELLIRNCAKMVLFLSRSDWLFFKPEALLI